MGIYKASRRLGKREAEEQWVHEPQHYKINTHALPYGATVGSWCCTKRHTAPRREAGRMLAAGRQCLHLPTLLSHPRRLVMALAFAATQVNAVRVITFCVILGKTGGAMSSIQTEQGMLSFMIALIFVLFRGAFILRIRGGRWDLCRAVKKGLQTCCDEPFFDLHQWPLEMSPWSQSSITPLRLRR